MVGIVGRGYKQICTWWAATPNGSGGDFFAAPVLCTCRWENRQETFVGQVDRRERVSKAVVYIDRAVSVGDYLTEGDFTATGVLTADPTGIVSQDCDKVQRYTKQPDLRNLEVQHKAML